MLKEEIQQLDGGLEDDGFGDVMVVGGGISGIQASLDLATAGLPGVPGGEIAGHRRAHGPVGQRPIRPTTCSM